MVFFLAEPVVVSYMNLTQNLTQDVDGLHLMMSYQEQLLDMRTILFLEQESKFVVPNVMGI